MSISAANKGQCPSGVSEIICYTRLFVCKARLISRTDKVELIATEFFQQSYDCLGYLEQHTKSCKSYLVGKYNYFLLKDDHFYAKSGH